MQPTAGSSEARDCLCQTHIYVLHAKKMFGAPRQALSPPMSRYLCHSLFKICVEILRPDDGPRAPGLLLPAGSSRGSTEPGGEAFDSNHRSLRPILYHSMHKVLTCACPELAAGCVPMRERMKAQVQVAPEVRTPAASPTTPQRLQIPQERPCKPLNDPQRPPTTLPRSLSVLSAQHFLQLQLRPVKGTGREKGRKERGFLTLAWQYRRQLLGLLQGGGCRRWRPQGLPPADRVRPSLLDQGQRTPMVSIERVPSSRSILQRLQAACRRPKRLYLLVKSTRRSVRGPSGHGGWGLSYVPMF